MMDVIARFGSERVFEVEAIIEWHLRKKAEEKIRIKYTDDEFGVAAREFGLPKRAYPGDAGLDLITVLDADGRKHGHQFIHPDERICLHTGLIAEFPIGHWGLIMHRSSSERRFRLRVVEGVIDDYRNELLVQVHNPNSWPIAIEHGQKIAQLVLFSTKSFECEEATELRPSRRGANGFGSSGYTAT